MLQKRPMSFVGYQDVNLHCPVCGAGNQELTLCGGGSYLSVPRRLRVYSQNGQNVIMESTLLHCSACSLQYLNPMPPREILENHYKNSALLHGTYTLERFLSAINDVDNKKDVNTVMDWLCTTFQQNRDFFSSGYLMDVGCNAGGFIKAAKDMGMKCLGIEIDQKLCDWNKTFIGCEVFAGMFEDIPETYNDSASVIVIKDSLEHHLTPVTTLSIARRLLKEGGVLFVEVPNIGCLLAQHNIEAFGWFEADHLVYFSKNSIRTAFEKSKFTNIVVSSAPASNLDRSDVIVTGLGHVDVSWSEVEKLIAQEKGRKLWCAGRK
ncbi:MAG: class I SAM-dependent methyltransferase [Candidatus Riflebacteria bacterium]|nr:class I SAM-dependent methyltransferase [Candidatus Riflebacteria bacterium]